MQTVYSTTMAHQQNAEIEKTVRRERGRLFNFIRKRVGNDPAAEDILQDVFGQLIETYRRLETIERVTSWLFQVARNKIIDSYRKKSPASTSMDGEGPELSLEDILPDLSDGPETLYARELIWSEIETALEELPTPQRDVFIWHEFDGMSFKDIAERTGETENALRLRKHYAVRSLRVRLESLYEDVRRGK